MMIHTERVTYLSGDDETELTGYVAAPAVGGPHPVVLILRGVAGPEDGYTEIADRVAGWGYLAFLHGWKIRGDDPPDSLVSVDITGALGYLRERSDVDRGRIAVFGFCRGGVHTLMAATAHADIRLAVIFHGFAFRPERAQAGLQPYDLAQKISVRTLIMHGTQDEQAPIEGMRRLEERVCSLKRPIRFKYYDGIRHGFAVRTHPGFDAPTAKDSFEEARKFLVKEMLPAA
jgi:carboxymethylenebutenolidase